MADEHDDNVDENYNPEEEVTGDWAQVNLPEVPVVTGEEDDECINSFRCKLYRWRNQEWKERGIGEMKFLQNSNTKKIRILMRQEKTKKIVANHYIQAQSSLCQLIAQKTSDKAWLWDCCDISDEQPQLEKLCAKFVKVEDAQKFKEVFESAYENNKKLGDNKQQDDKKVEKKEEKKEEDNSQQKQPENQQKEEKKD